ncbi:MAG: potassium channel family protein [Polyangiaceae bacterium]
MTKDLKSFSPVTFAFERLFFALQYTSPANLLFGTRLNLQHGLTEDEIVRNARRRGRQIEAYVFTWALVEAVCVGVTSARHGECQALETIAIVIVACRVLEIFQAGVNLNLFDQLRSNPGSHRVASTTRLIVLSAWNFAELIVCFGVVYGSSFATLSDQSGGLTPYYFSLITQFTIGYGDICPKGGTRAIAMAQASLGFLFALFALSRLVAFLPRARPVVDEE